MAIEVVDPTIFASVEPVALRGSSCSGCGSQVFPALASCPVCSGVDVSDVVLPTTGTVWSWTTQRFAPKAPFRTDEFAPFSIGYVDLGSVIVEGWLVGKTQWEIGEQVRLVLAKAWTEGDQPVHTFGFESVR
jgi:uncharacterized OB-fold protein